MRDAAIRRALEPFDDGSFSALLRRHVACKTESPGIADRELMRDYLTQQITPLLSRLGFSSSVFENPLQDANPFLIAQRSEDPGLPTVLIYGHGDVVRGDDALWRSDLSPWALTIEGDHWYGRGSADNKGQFLVNLTALEAAIAEGGGRLGFNVKILFETGEEIGSPGLREIAIAQRELLKADVFIASDGNRVSASNPTLFLGSRGEVEFEIALNARSRPYHSGNWGGVLSNPATILAHVITKLVDERGRIVVEGLRPPSVPEHVRALLAEVPIGEDDDAPSIDDDWGEPGLTPAERIFGWNTIETLALKAADADAPGSAIPARAKAICQLRFVVGTKASEAKEILLEHLAQNGFHSAEVTIRSYTPATRLDPHNPWALWAMNSIERSARKVPTLLPNLGGTLPNYVFSELLELPTLWIPHSYPACAQHGPNEHLLASVVRESLAIMAGLWWDLGHFEDATR
nr:glutamate carboxypeptidase-like protein [Bradyrhizobium sp. DOA9]